HFNQLSVRIRRQLERFTREFRIPPPLPQSRLLTTSTPRPSYSPLSSFLRIPSAASKGRRKARPPLVY
ncbi:hypothetical protein BDN70DRAFT_889240, partial [Pholiota conissans]